MSENKPQPMDLDDVEEMTQGRAFYDPHQLTDGSACPMGGTPFDVGDLPVCAVCGQSCTVNGGDPLEHVPHVLHTQWPTTRRHVDEFVCPWRRSLASVGVETDIWGHTAAVITWGERELILGPSYSDAVKLAGILTRGMRQGREDTHAWLISRWRESSTPKGRAEEGQAMQLASYRRDADLRRHLSEGQEAVEAARAHANYAGRPQPWVSTPPEVLLDRVLGSMEVGFDVARHFNCGEANNIALALRLMGRTEGAAVFLAGHALGDDEGDLHPNWPETNPLEDQQHPVWDYGWPPESH